MFRESGIFQKALFFGRSHLCMQASHDLLPRFNPYNQFRLSSFLEAKNFQKPVKKSHECAFPGGGGGGGEGVTSLIKMKLA